ncbi:MAG: hypothetical protein M1829_005148 [Trizodia sp. TS-e1964]|nr:MAG: hypothetical protein M1829_005148 [Trizodia sp. TS-e1964]
MNVFRILGDVSHTLSKCILIWAIHSNKSAEGVSLITQALYVGVFLSRYLDMFWSDPFGNYNRDHKHNCPECSILPIWNFVLKIFYISSSLYIILVMTRLYARTREREQAWRLGLYCLGGSLIAAPIVTPILEGAARFQPMEILWVFSIILESVCVLPQLLLLRQTTVPTVIDSFYLVTLGSYRALYLLNWIYKYSMDGTHDTVAIIFGIIQTALYADFAWVYWTRQRVKLRNGGIVDSDDLSRSWLVRLFLGRAAATSDVENSANANHPPGRARNDGGWGARGISVSADEGVFGPAQKKNDHSREPAIRDDELAGILEDDEDDSDAEDVAMLPPSQLDQNSKVNGLSGGEEWRDINKK